MLRRPSRNWSRSEHTKRYVISRYTLKAGNSPYTVGFWIRCFFLFSILTLFVSLKFALSLVSRRHERPDEAHPFTSLRGNAGIHHFDYSSSRVRSGTSLVAACQNDHEKLRRSLPTWIQQQNLSEIVIVDWGSTPPLRFVVEEVDIHSENHAPIHVVHVRNAGKWIPSQALNFAFHAAQYSQILKVSCSHELEPNFVDHHPLRLNSFVVGGLHLERLREEEIHREVMFIPRKVFVDVGGYDERLRENGAAYEDLVERLSSKGMQRVDLDYDKIGVVANHVHDEDSLSSHSARVAMEIELELRKRLPLWKATNFNDSAIMGRKNLEEQCRIASFRHSLVYYSDANRSEEVTSLRAIAEPNLMRSIEQSVLTRNLQRDFSLPGCVLNNLGLPAQRTLFTSLYNRSTPMAETKLIVVHCFSSFPSRINLLLTGLTLSKQSGHVPVVLWERSLEHESTRINDVFKVPQNVVVLEDFPRKSAAHLDKCKGKGFSSNVAMKSLGHNPIILGDSLQNVEYLKTDMPVRSENIKLLNDKLMAKEFKNLILADQIERALGSFKDVGVESSIGLYVGSHSVLGNSSHAGNLEVFTAVQEEIKLQRKKRGMFEAKVYLDAEKSFVQRFYEDEKKMIENAWLLEARKNELAYLEHSVRIFALSMTKTFSSFSDDETSTLIGLLRQK